MKIKSIYNLEEQFLWKDNVGLVTKLLGEAAGSTKIFIYINPME